MITLCNVIPFHENPKTFDNLILGIRPWLFMYSYFIFPLIERTFYSFHLISWEFYLMPHKNSTSWCLMRVPFSIAFPVQNPALIIISTLTFQISSIENQFISLTPCVFSAFFSLSLLKESRDKLLSSNLSSALAFPLYFPVYVSVSVSLTIMPRFVIENKLIETFSTQLNC